MTKIEYYKRLQQGTTTFYARKKNGLTLLVTLRDSLDTPTIRHTIIRKFDSKTLPFISIDKAEFNENYNIALAQNDSFLNP